MRAFCTTAAAVAAAAALACLARPVAGAWAGARRSPGAPARDARVGPVTTTYVPSA